VSLEKFVSFRIRIPYGKHPYIQRRQNLKSLLNLLRVYYLLFILRSKYFLLYPLQKFLNNKKVLNKMLFTHLFRIFVSEKSPRS